MTEHHSLRETRISKLERIRELGIEPYPYRYDRTAGSHDLKQQYAQGTLVQNTSRIAGRMILYRDHGKTAFAQVQDGDGIMQVYIEKNMLPKSNASLLELLDIGDYIGVEGTLFTTKKGEPTIRVKEYTLLAKTLQPLPEKWHGLQNPELLYRHRSEYFVAHPEKREQFKKRSKAIAALRTFLDEHDFLEVETPLIQPVYGGASARPFKTYVNAFGEEQFLSISPEIYLKRLIAGGFERVYTVCKNFRNENIDRTHNPEFTMMECYQSYADYTDMMELTENLYAHIFKTVLGSTKVQYRDPDSLAGVVEIDVAPPWRRITMLDAVAEYSGINAELLSENDLRNKISKIEDKEFFKKVFPGELLKSQSWGELVQGLFSHYAEKKFIQPTFVIDHPRETTPLCKIHRRDPRLIERFEPFIYGWEIGNAYSELNDPMRQRNLLEEQIRTRTSDEIPSEIDEDFLRAIDLGMPPTGGLGLGIDRLAMLMTNAYAIKDVILFPMIRRQENLHG